MMMNYLYVSKKKKPQQSSAFWMLLVAVILIGGCILLFRSSLFSLFTSWWRGESSFIQSAGVATSWFGDKVELANRISELENENSELHGRITELEAKGQAYDDLVGEIGTSTESQGMLTKIIRRPPFTVFDTYVVDKGSADQIAVGDAAYARGMPVGIVQSVTDANATVSLYSSPGEKILLSFGTTTMQYEGYGIGNGTIRADIPRDAPVSEGMAVTAADRAVSLYGTVKAVEKDPAGTDQSVFISLPFDIQNTSWLVIHK